MSEKIQEDTKRGASCYDGCDECRYFRPFIMIRGSIWWENSTCKLRRKTTGEEKSVNDCRADNEWCEYFEQKESIWEKIKGWFKK